MSRKIPILLISGWLTTLTLVMFVWERSSIPVSPAARVALLLLAIGPPGIWAVLFGRASTRSVTQILYEEENRIVPITAGDAR